MIKLSLAFAGLLAFGTPAFAQDNGGMGAPPAAFTTPSSVGGASTRDFQAEGVVSQKDGHYTLTLVGGPIVEGSVRQFQLNPKTAAEKKKLDGYVTKGGYAEIKGSLVGSSEIDVQTVTKGSNILPLAAMDAKAPTTPETDNAAAPFHGLGPASMVVDQHGIANVKKSGKGFEITPINQGPLSPNEPAPTTYKVLDPTAAQKKVLEDAATKGELVQFSGFSRVPYQATDITLSSGADGLSVFHGAIPLMAAEPTDKDGMAPPTKDGSNFAADAIKAAAAAAAKDGLTVEGGSGVDPRIVARGQDSGPRTGMGQILDKKMDDAKSGDTAKPEDR